MSKYDEKVANIRYNHILLLKKVKESIIENKDHLSESLDSVITVLNVEEESSKKYQALVQAQELILSLTQEIVDADSLEQVIELRKKVNYYVNKIKNELKKRESSEELLLDYQTKVTYLRKDIAKYIRFLKRESIINEIESTNPLYDELNEEDKKKFQKLVRNETRYNTRNIDSFHQEQIVSVPSIEKKENETSTSDTKEEIIFDFPDLDQSKKDQDSTSVDFEKLFQDQSSLSTESVSSLELEDDDLSPAYKEHLDGSTFSFRHSKEISQISFSEADPYLSKKLLDYMKQYDIVDTIDYGTSPIKNFVSFLKNIPRYISNRKRIKIIQRDLSMFYRGSDLISFYEYTKRRNSIKNGLRSIFKNTHLYSDEDMYLSQHEKCSQWVYEFCKKNSMNMLIPLELSK